MAGDDDWRDLRRRELHGDMPKLGDDRPRPSPAPGNRPGFGDDRPSASPAAIGDTPAEPVVYRGRSTPTPSPPPPTPAARRRRWLPYAAGAGLATAGVVGWLLLDRPGSWPVFDRPDGVTPALAALAASDAARPSCSAPATLAGLRAIVFARARHIGGPNPAWLETQAAAATLRVGDAHLTAFDAKNAITVCAGTLALTLPGTTVSGGAPLPTPTVDYSLVPTSDARGWIYTLDGAESVIRRLVELELLPTETPAPVALAPAAPPVAPPRALEEPAATTAGKRGEAGARPGPAASSAWATGPAAPRVSAAKASARKLPQSAKHASVEAMIRGNTSLTALDNTAKLLAPAPGAESPRATAREQAAFVARRNRCSTRDCIARIYRARIDRLAHRRASEAKAPAAAPAE